MSRLEEIKKYESIEEVILKRKPDEDKWWLINRVEKLENHLKLYEFWYRTAYDQNKRYREVIEDIKETADDYRAGHLLDIQDSFFVDEIIAIINNLEGDLDERN